MGWALNDLFYKYRMINVQITLCHYLSNQRCTLDLAKFQTFFKRFNFVAIEIMWRAQTGSMNGFKKLIEILFNNRNQQTIVKNKIDSRHFYKKLLRKPKKWFLVYYFLFLCGALIIWLTSSFPLNFMSL